MTINEHYIKKTQTPGDIWLHLPTLLRYAQECKHITEFGVRKVVSTWAFLNARPEKLISYDIKFHPEVIEAQTVAIKEGVHWEYILKDTKTVIIENTDLLFIDTLHTAKQLKIELENNYNQVKKYIILHDTTAFEWIKKDGSEGLWFAVRDFLKQNQNWQVAERSVFNCGLTVLKNIQHDKNLIGKI